jgi:nucleoside-diphosphate-sugar epimerase
MQPHKKVAVIGGTGKAGKYLVKRLLAQNIFIKFLQHKSGTTYADNPLVEILEGDARTTTFCSTCLQAALP